MMPVRYLRCCCCLPAMILLTTALVWGADEQPQQLLKTFHEEFVAITPGQGKFPKTFKMGSESGPANERPVHEVTFEYSFAIAKYEIGRAHV